MSVSPVDDAFPQLVRLHDPRYLVDMLAAAGAGDVAAEDLTVETVRYRPGQRHVLRVGTGPNGPAWFVKVYRDDTGRRAVDAAARAATALAAGVDRCASGHLGWRGVRAAGPGGAVARGDRYVPGRCDRRVRFRGSGRRPGCRACPAAGARRTAGRGAAGSAPTRSRRPSETLRTAQLVDALLPAVGLWLRVEVGRVLDVLSRLPAEPPTMTHGDFKCDNLVVNGSRVHLLDFDRSGRGDPAADIGKFLADLRWWADAGGHPVAPLHEAFLRRVRRHGTGAVRESAGVRRTVAAADGRPSRAGAGP